jgi:hypothetical protein
MNSTNYFTKRSLNSVPKRVPRYWAIRTGDYVEIRRARVRPKAVYSKLVKPGPPKIVIATVFYEGGIVLGACRNVWYCSLVQVELRLADGDIIEIPRNIRTAALQKRVG